MLNVLNITLLLNTNTGINLSSAKSVYTRDAKYVIGVAGDDIARAGPDADTVPNSNVTYFLYIFFDQSTFRAS